MHMIRIRLRPDASHLTQVSNRSHVYFSNKAFSEILNQKFFFEDQPIEGAKTI